MRILITNDDSISATQLLPLIRWCQKLGDVTTVVPKFEQSGKSHGIELHKAFEAMEVELVPGLKVWTVDSTPADCVRFAILGLKQEFDLVISGVNKGFNMGLDIMYSGTVAAVCEAVALGVPAIAFSTSIKAYDVALQSLDRVWAFFQKHSLMEKSNLYNVNIPLEPQGIRITRQGAPYYTDDFQHIGNNMYRPTGRCIHEDQHNMEIDTDAVVAGYISVMPMDIRRNDMPLFEQLKSLHE
ncbi:MAG: 5'/3'-nucleotidase SurE [Oscillospiraceae bacterium]|nr:5'/3'-nucleotidase SurE [Oscillospiraceae bacterium]